MSHKSLWRMRKLRIFAVIEIPFYYVYGFSCAMVLIIMPDF